MSESNKKWYVLRAAGGKEKKAKEYLEKEIERCGLQDLVSQVLVPTEKVYRIRDGKRICTERLFYPGYVLIEAELTGELQHIIRNEIPHMSGFLTEKRDRSYGDGKVQEEKRKKPKSISKRRLKDVAFRTWFLRSLFQQKKFILSAEESVSVQSVFSIRAMCL